MFHTGIRLKGRSAEHSPTRFYDAPNGNARISIDASSINITSSGSSSTSGFNNDFGSASGLFGGASASFDGSRGSFRSSASISSQNGTLRAGFGSGTSSQSSDGTDQSQFKTNIFMPSPILEKEVKDEVDWRKEGAITPVKNQGETFIVMTEMFIKAVDIIYDHVISYFMVFPQ